MDLHSYWLQTYRRKLLQTNSPISLDTPTGRPAAFFDLGSATIDQLHALNSEAASGLRAEVTLRLQLIERQMLQQTLTFAIGVGLLVYQLTSFFVTFQASLRVLRRGTDAMARRDLAHRTEVRGRDELAAIGRTVDATYALLSGMVAEIRSRAALLNLAGNQVADGSQRLSERTDDQANSLRNSVDVIGQLSLAVAQNAQAARELDDLTGGLAQQAEQGHAAMTETVGSMQQMQDASQRVTELVGQHAGAVPGLEPTSFLAHAWAAADSGGGWIQYEVVSPGTKVVTPKESYILPLGQVEFIGCGAYRREGAAAAQVHKPLAPAWARADEQPVEPTPA